MYKYIVNSIKQNNRTFKTKSMVQFINKPFITARIKNLDDLSTSINVFIIYFIIKAYAISMKY